jgi:hypothetical protein
MSIDIRRAEWFRLNAKFDRTGVVSRQTIWHSWSKFAGDDRGTKREMILWILALGIMKHPVCGDMYVGMRVLAP